MVRKSFTFDGARYWVKAQTERECFEKMALRKRDLEEGRKKITKNMTVKVWSEEWLSTYIEGSVSDRTYKNYECRVNIVLDQIGILQLKDVKQIHCQKILKMLSGKSKDHIMKTYRAMWNMFDVAVANGLILNNPANRLSIPQAINGTGRKATDYEREIILRVSEYHQYGLWVLTMLFCGLRPGETARVQGRHINYKMGTLYIDGTKTKNARREVPLPDELANKFKALKLDPFEYAFKNTVGGQLSDTNISKRWHNFKRELNIAAGCRVHRNQLVPPYPIADDLTPYCLRHTFCTDAISAGVPLNIVQKLMGHEKISTTATYAHETDDYAVTAAETLKKFRDCDSGCDPKADNR